MAIKKYFGKQFRGKLRCIACALITIWALLIFNQTVTAQDGKVKDKKAKVNIQQEYAAKLKKYFLDKYGKDTNFHVDIIDIQKTPSGPQGTLYVSDINTSSKIKKMLLSEDRIERARDIAHAFMKEEATILGIKDMDGIHERHIDAEGTIVHLYLEKHIGDLKLDGSDVHIVIDSEENISLVNAHLLPVSPELYKAVKKETITEERVRQIIDQDVKSAKPVPAKRETREIEKIAIVTPPYVVWKATNIWEYTINAFTGEILKKNASWR